ncbi:hypothetical protein TNCT_644511 [Trichonephila clavata]|uniref:Uncharacterized protein n=1 Tax=Trichonephila clavata TaxID=2740835 RepID=A0A8X6HDL7_TRICU|nr:hypothetical protein TNCT_644511 [Trichonephila clavata]
MELVVCSNFFGYIICQKMPEWQNARCWNKLQWRHLVLGRNPVALLVLIFPLPGKSVAFDSICFCSQIISSRSIQDLSTKVQHRAS